MMHIVDMFFVNVERIVNILNMTEHVYDLIIEKHTLFLRM